MFVVHQLDGTLAHIPCWMMSEAAAHHDLRSEPRLPLRWAAQIFLSFRIFNDLVDLCRLTGQSNRIPGRILFIPSMAQKRSLFR